MKEKKKSILDKNWKYAKYVSDEINELKNQIQDQKEEIKGLYGQQEEVESKMPQAQKEMAKLESDVDKLRLQYLQHLDVFFQNFGSVFKVLDMKNEYLDKIINRLSELPKKNNI